MSYDATAHLFWGAIVNSKLLDAAARKRDPDGDADALVSHYKFTLVSLSDIAGDGDDVVAIVIKEHKAGYGGREVPQDFLERPSEVDTERLHKLLLKTKDPKAAFGLYLGASCL